MRSRPVRHAGMGAYDHTACDEGDCPSSRLACSAASSSTSTMDFTEKAMKVTPTITVSTTAHCEKVARGLGVQAVRV